MKRIFALFLMSAALFLTSCKVRVVDAEKPLKDNTLELYKKYTIQTNDAKTVNVQVLKIDADKIYGKTKTGETLEIDKGEIREIKKTDLLSSIAIGVGAVLALILIPV